MVMLPINVSKYATLLFLCAFLPLVCVGVTSDMLVLYTYSAVKTFSLFLISSFYVINVADYQRNLNTSWNTIYCVNLNLILVY